ncbi:MAG: LTA synthase family protein [Lachnospiraceae bacterium]|nr:LTA synthase family protein [Lachnospiraceae bacterium]
MSSMLVVWSSIAIMLLYCEVVYHVSSFGLKMGNPIYSLFLILVWSALVAMLVGMVRGKGKKILHFGAIWLIVIWTALQVVYLRIFKQPLLWDAVWKGGKDALTNYWREALEGVVKAAPYLIILILPVLIGEIVSHKKKWKPADSTGLQIMRMLVVLVVGLCGCFVTMQVGRQLKLDYYEEYKEFYDPLSVAEAMGMWPTLQRDITYHTEQETEAFVQRLYAKKAELAAMQKVSERDESVEGVPSGAGNATASAMPEGSTQEGMMADATTTESITTGGTPEGGATDSIPEKDATDGTPEKGATDAATTESTAQAEVEEPVIRPQEFAIDFATLQGLAENKKQSWLAEYIEGLTPVTTNEYTGIFEGYNLIYLSAEGFSTYAVHEELTPTLYRLTHSGFVFENYYVPIWQTSTSDGEYINCTALIPDGQFSMQKSAVNHMAYTLPRFFEKEGVTSYAYHNNSLSYYDRYLSHPNLGYDFKGCKLGSVSEKEWGDKVFYMENPNAWPASDLEMMQGTVAEYVQKERFHVYYMTVSGHMNYNFKGNAMSGKNREAVANLDMSENARAYIACNIELDKALEYLLAELEKAGQLEKTVICLSADHYPYGMTTEQYGELAGKTLTEGMDLYRNSLILWNAGMEENTVVVDKVCGSMDIVPTLLNLFGFSYDSRMYAGRDIFSKEEGLVIF